MVIVRLFGHLQEITGLKEYYIKIFSEISFLDLIKVVDKRLGSRLSEAIFDSEGKIRSSYVILINGTAVRDADPNKIMITNDDIVAILPPAVGG